MFLTPESGVVCSFAHLFSLYFSSFTFFHFYFHFPRWCCLTLNWLQRCCCAIATFSTFSLLIFTFHSYTVNESSLMMLWLRKFCCSNILTFDQNIPMHCDASDSRHSPPEESSRSDIWGKSCRYKIYFSSCDQVDAMSFSTVYIIKRELLICPKTFLDNSKNYLTKIWSFLKLYFDQ